MSVDSLEHDPLSVELHQVICYLKPSEAHLLGNHLQKLPLFIPNLNQQLIQLRLFRTPKKRIFHGERHMCSFPVLRRHSLAPGDHPAGRYLSGIAPESLVISVISILPYQIGAYLSVSGGLQIHRQLRLIEGIV